MFHLLVACINFWDFYITGLILGNYSFQIGLSPGFLNHRQSYVYICTIQSIDILLNFLKLEGHIKRNNINPMVLFKNYLMGTFVTDVIAVIPYSYFSPGFIFLRYLKIMKLNTYITYIEDSVTEYAILLINGQVIKELLNIFRLLMIIMIITHFFGCLWVWIGLYYKIKYEQGWIVKAIGGGILVDEGFFDIYIASVFWIITTFTSVGYGDITGEMPFEYLF